MLLDRLYLTVLKENSKEIEYLLWGKSPNPFAGPADGRAAKPCVANRNALQISMLRARERAAPVGTVF